MGGGKLRRLVGTVVVLVTTGMTRVTWATPASFELHTLPSLQHPCFVTERHLHHHLGHLETSSLPLPHLPPSGRCQTGKKWDLVKGDSSFAIMGSTDFGSPFSLSTSYLIHLNRSLCIYQNVSSCLLASNSHSHPRHFTSSSNTTFFSSSAAHLSVKNFNWVLSNHLD